MGEGSGCFSIAAQNDGPTEGKRTAADLQQIAKEVRANILRQMRDRAAHVGSALSIADILVAVYFGWLEIRPEKQECDRDRFILSKGHGALALYAVLHKLGFIETSDLLGERPERPRLPSLLSSSVPGVDLGSGGSLGHGLGVGAGIALGNAKDGKDVRTVVLVGDGELNEGSVWEAGLFAAHQKLNRLTMIVDRNGKQIEGNTEDILAIEPLADKWRAFGWRVVCIDGHDMRSLQQSLGDIDKLSDPRPSAIICTTIKGKGVSFMEAEDRWHMGKLDAAEYSQALHEVTH